MAMQSRQPSCAVVDKSSKHESRLTEQSLFSSSPVVQSSSLSKQHSKSLAPKRKERRSCGERGSMLVDSKTRVKCTEEIQLEEDVFMKGNNSEKTQQSLQRRQQASVSSRTKSSSQVRKRRQQKSEVSSIEPRQQREIHLSTSQYCRSLNLLEPSSSLAESKSLDTENQDSVRLCFVRNAVICNSVPLPVTDSECLQLLDSKIPEEKADKNTLVVEQTEKLMCLTKLTLLPDQGKKNPVVRLFDCRYIKALVNSNGDISIQIHKLHCGFVQGIMGKKVLSSNRGMGQNDLNCSPNIVQTRKSLRQTYRLVRKRKSQNRRNSSLAHQPGNKRFMENKWLAEFKKPRKKIKMPENLGKSAVWNSLPNADTDSEYKLQTQDEIASKDSSVASKKLNSTFLPLVDHTPVFLLGQHAQNPQNQPANLPSSEKVNDVHFVPYNASDLRISEVGRDKSVLESKSTKPQIDFSNKAIANSLLEMNHNGNIGSCRKREKRTLKEKTVSNAGKKLQLFSCQRAVPISGKNVWPRESCARTSLWVCKNHASNSEIRVLSSTDSFVITTDQSCGHTQLQKPLENTSKISANTIVNYKTQLSGKSPTPESLLDECKVIASTGHKTRVSSTEMECPKQYTSFNAKNIIKSKMALHSLVKGEKNKGSKAKKNISIDTQSGTAADIKSKTTCQKTPVAKQELVVLQPLKTLNSRTLTRFKIPLLKDKTGSKKVGYDPSSERDTCSRLDSLENSDFEKRAKVKEIPLDVNSQLLLHSEQFNGAIVALEEYADQLNHDVPGDYLKEIGVCNKASHDSELESSTLKDVLHSLSEECIEKPVLNSVVASEISEENYSNNLVQEREKFCIDILKAYEDDVLVIDVIQDDPDLFGDPDEQKVTDTKEHSTKNVFNTSISTKEKLKLELESSLLLRNQHLKDSPRDDPVQDYEICESVTDVCDSLIEVGSIKSKCLSGTDFIGDVTETSLKNEPLTEFVDLIKSSDSDEKYTFSDKMVAVREETVNIETMTKTETAQNPEYVIHNSHLKLPLPAMKSFAGQHQGTTVKPRMNDFRISRSSLLPSPYPPNYGTSKGGGNAMDKLYLTKIPSDTKTNLGLALLPPTYCRLHFNTLKGCERSTCWFRHVPEAGDEKICNEILKKYISIGEIVLLKRAVQIFTDFCKLVTSEVHLDSEMLDELLTSLLQSCLLKEVFHVFHASIMIKMLPNVDTLLKVFDYVASVELREAVPELTDISCKLIDAGIILEFEHFGYITKSLNQLQVSNQEINIFMARFQGRYFHKNGLCDLDSAIAEFQHCKEKGDWAKLGTLYINVRRGCENADDYENYSLCIVNILTNVAKEERQGVPFAEFAAAVGADPRHNDADKTLLGRIGISVMHSYYKTRQWLKARKVLDALHALQIQFTFLKGLVGPERLAARCSIVNVAVEIFLKSGSLSGAIWVLRESDWIINTPSWPCDRMDVLNRHNLLCTMATDYITKSHYREAFEVLQNLPGFQNSCDTLDVSQYNLLFNKLLDASSKSENLGMSCTVIQFMLTKNIPVDFDLLRALITALGRSCLWLKARTHYRNALALGCYPPMEGNLYHKCLRIPSYMTEVEMLLAIEIFLVSNASSIQSFGASSQILQIVLKRCEGSNGQNQDDYQNAVERLIQAAHISNPKLFIKCLTVNVNKEQVYSLEHACALKWLKENMKWAGKVWLFQ